MEGHKADLVPASGFIQVPIFPVRCRDWALRFEVDAPNQIGDNNPMWALPFVASLVFLHMDAQYSCSDFCRQLSIHDPRNACQVQCNGGWPSRNTGRGWQWRAFLHWPPTFQPGDGLTGPSGLLVAHPTPKVWFLVCDLPELDGIKPPDSFPLNLHLHVSYQNFEAVWMVSRPGRISALMDDRCKAQHSDGIFRLETVRIPAELFQVTSFSQLVAPSAKVFLEVFNEGCWRHGSIHFILETVSSDDLPSASSHDRKVPLYWFPEEFCSPFKDFQEWLGRLCSFRPAIIVPPSTSLQVDGQKGRTSQKSVCYLRYPGKIIMSPIHFSIKQGKMTFAKTWALHLEARTFHPPESILNSFFFGEQWLFWPVPICILNTVSQTDHSPSVVQPSILPLPQLVFYRSSW